MAAAGDFQAGTLDEFRLAIIVALRRRGEGGEAVELRQGARDALQVGDVRGERGQQFLVKAFFQRQRAIVGGKRLVLEVFKFRRDVAFGAFQSLAAAIVVRHLVRVGVGDLDEEAMHLVVFDLEAGDAGARFLAGLEIEQELPAIGLDRAQLVEFAIEAGGDGAAVPQQRRRFAGQRAVELFEAQRGAMQIVAQGLQQSCTASQQIRDAGQLPQGFAQAARSRGRALLSAMRVPMRSTSATLAQQGNEFCQRLAAIRIQQCGDGAVARGGNRAVGERMMQAMAQPARAHRGGAGIEQREQRRRRLAAQRFGDFEIAARGGIEPQPAGFALQRQPGDMGERLQLGGLGILQQGAGRAECQWRGLASSGR